MRGSGGNPQTLTNCDVSAFKICLMNFHNLVCETFACTEAVVNIAVYILVCKCLRHVNPFYKDD